MEIFSGIKQGGVIAFTLLIVAGGVDSAAKETQARVDVTDEDRVVMMSAARQYDACLRQEADTAMTVHTDVRQAADAAMEKCRPVLEGLDRALTDRGLDPGLRAGFVRHTRDSSVRRLLPALMAQRAAEGQQ